MAKHKFMWELYADPGADEIIHYLVNELNVSREKINEDELRYQLPMYIGVECEFDDETNELMIISADQNLPKRSRD